MPRLKKAKSITRLEPFSARRLLLFIVPFAVLGGYLLWQSFAASGTIKLYLNPSTITVTKGSGFPVKINLQNSGGADIHYVDAYLTFPADKLSCSVSTSGSYFPSASTLSCNNSNGTIHISLSNGQTTPPSVGDAFVAQINFSTKSTGNATVSFTNQTTVSKNSNSPNQLSFTVPGTYTVVNPPFPGLSFSANPTNIKSGSSSTLSWSSTNASSCSASGAWTGAKPVTGTASTGALKSNAAYTLSCSGSGGTVTKSVTVIVSAAATSPTGGSSTATPPGSTLSPPPSQPQAANITPENTPFITDVSVANITNNSAHFSWKTTKAAASKLSYGGNIDEPDSTLTFDQPVIEHETVLSKLGAGKTYYFTISASESDHEYKYQGNFRTAGGLPTASSPNVTAEKAKKGLPKVVIVLLVALLSGGAAIWVLASGGKTKRPKQLPRHTPPHEPSPRPPHHEAKKEDKPPSPKSEPAPKAAEVKSDAPAKPEPHLSPLPHQAHTAYVPHSLIPKEQLLHKSRTGSIAADSIDEPKDMFEEGRERLAQEGLVKNEPPAKR